jgi:hypothetical protein
MPKVTAGWSGVEGDPSILTYLYSFGGGLAKAFAVRGPHGFVVFSPPCKVPEQAFTELESKGPIAALVASNAFHLLGLPTWSARFKDARIFAPAQSVARVSKKTSLRVSPLAEAQSLAGTKVELVDMPHYRTGEALVRVRSDRGLVWFVTDVIFNMPVVPPGPVGLLFKWTGSAPGLKLNGLGTKLMVKDKRSLWSWLVSEIRREPPTTLVTAHGLDVGNDAGTELLKVFPKPFVDA